jgi:uncharacterized phage protein gp47/JayE
MAELVPPPDLDIRDEEQIAAQAIGFTCAPQTLPRIDFQIGVMRELRARVEAGMDPPPVCPELTNANPDKPHVVLLEVMSWLIAIIARRINRLPVKVQVEFARLFGVELREATLAETTLRFTVAPPDGEGAVIPVDTTVRSADGAYTFLTIEELVLAPGVNVGDVAARRNVAGATTLAPDVLTVLTDPVAWVESVTNPEAVESGTDAETVESALARARRYQRRGERLVSAQDLEEAILDDVLLGNGIVRAFPFIMDGVWDELTSGHTTIVVMTRAGAPVSDAAKQQIATTMQQAVGTQFIYVKDPEFVEFNISAAVRLEGLTPQDAIIAGVKKRLEAFYAPTAQNFGKSAFQSDIIGLIEGSPGVERIERQPGGELLAAPADDVEVAPYQMPRLGTVTLNVI